MLKIQILEKKAAAYAVTNIMKAKSKFSMGLKSKKRIGKKRNGKKRKRRVQKNKLLNFKTVLSAAKKGLNKKSKNSQMVIKLALTSARKVAKKRDGKKKFKLPNILALPKVLGGALPLIPIFAGLSALGALTNGVAGITKAISDAKTAKTIESTTIGKGLYLRPYKTG